MFFVGLVLLVLLELFLFPSSASAQSVNGTIFMAPPVVNGANRDVLLVMIPGGLVPNSDYQKTIGAVQRSVSRLNAYAVIVHCDFNLCVPLFQVGHVDAAIAAAVSHFGLRIAPDDVFVLGHSLGGVVARQYADAKYDAGVALGGVALFGVMFNQNSTGYPDDLAAYPFPLLALAGELDFTPLSHAAINFAQSAALPAAERYRKPTVLLPRVDHSDFCPGFHVSGDIVSESQHATLFIANVTALWMQVVTGVDVQQSSALLSQWMAQTSAMAAPFLIARALDERLWCEHAQRYLGDVQAVGAAALVVQNTTVVDGSVALTFAHTTYSLLDANTLAVSPVSYSRYDTDVQQKWAAPLDIACKAVSAQRVLAELRGGNPAPVTSLQCRALNVAALQNATQLLTTHWSDSIKRFAQQGKRVSVLADSQVTAGPVWVFENLAYAENATDITIQSVSLLTDISSWIYPGNAYCKLLSVSRAVEIIQTMALSKRYA
jgi:hypothetical protein